MAKVKTPIRKPVTISTDHNLFRNIQQGLLVIRELGEIACYSPVDSSGFVMAASDIASKLYADIEKLEGRSDD